MANQGVPTLCEVPADCIPIDVVEVCGYITPEGHRMFATRFTKDAPLSTVLGLMRLGEHQILRESENWDG